MSQIEELNQKLQHEKDKLKERMLTLSSMEKDYKKKQEIFNTTRDQMTKCGDDFALVERQDIQCREDIKHGKATEKKLNAKIKKHKKELEKLSVSMAAGEEEVPSLETQVEQLTAEHASEEQVHSLNSYYIHTRLKKTYVYTQTHIHILTSELVHVNGVRIYI